MSPGDEGLRILLVDPEDGDRREAREHLVDYRPLEAADLDDALFLYATEHPRCVVLAWTRDDPDALEALDRLSTMGACVLVVGPARDEPLAARARRHGAHDYVHKGLGFGERLAAAVESAVQRRSLEIELDRTEHYRRGLVQAIPDAIVRVGRRGRVLEAMNVEQTWGAGADLPGRHLDSLLPEDVAGPLSAQIDEVLESGGSRRLELDLQHPDGLRSFEARVARCGDEEAIIILRDDSERRRMELRLRASQRLEALGRLAGGVAHDFNNLLTIVRSCASFLLEDLEDDDARRADVVAIDAAAERGARLTDQLLAFSRRQVQELRRLDVDHVISDLSDLVARTVGDDVQTEMTVGPGRKTVLADVAQIEQIVMNLVVNAREAMPTGGTLHIETATVVLQRQTSIGGSTVPAGEYVRLTVQDSGVGMDESTAMQAFEPFFTTKADKGNGLGLATVYGIVKQSRGYITLDSAIGKGTTFSVFLPREPDAPQHDDEPEAAPPHRGGETVLVVDDEPLVRDVAGRILSRAGFRVLTASNASTAEQLARTHAGEIHALLTDVSMPDGLGSALVPRVRALRPEIGVVLMSGDVNQLAESDRCYARVAKPFGRQVLVDKVREVIDGEAAGREESHPRTH